MYMKIFWLKLFYVLVKNVLCFVSTTYLSFITFYIELCNVDFFKYIFMWDIVFTISSWGWGITIYFFFVKNIIVIKRKKKKMWSLNS